MDIRSIHNILTAGWTDLHVAAWEGKLEEVKCLVRRGRSVSLVTQDAHGDLAIMSALSANRLDVAYWFLNNGVNPKCKNNYDCTPLHFAASCGHTTFVEHLIHLEVDINAKMNRLDKRTALHEAAKEGHEDVTRLLIACGADVNYMETVHHHTALHWAAVKGKLECVKVLAQRTRLDKSSACRPIHLAAKYGHSNVVEWLVSNGEEVDVMNEDRQTSLHLAAFYGHYSVCNVLLKKGARVDARDGKWGRTAAHFAAIGGYSILLTLLAEWKADLYSFSTLEGLTPLHFACISNHSNCCRAIFSTKGIIDVPVKDKRKSLPIHLATAHGSTNVVMWLISNGVSVNERNGLGITPLQTAIKRNQYYLVRYLISQRADVNDKLSDGTDRTSLHLAAEMGQLDIARLLLEERPNVSARTSNYWTPAHYAAWNGSLEILKLLVINGADVKNCCTKDTGDQPIHLAIREGYQTVVEYLLKISVSPESTTAKGLTALQLAANVGNKTATELLLKKGASANNCTTHFDLTPLHYAVINHHTAIVKLLLSAGANLNAVAMGKMAIHFAAENGNVICMDLFREKGVDLKIRTRTIKGHTPLHLACMTGKFFVVYWLLLAGIPVDIEDSSGYTPLYYAVNHSDILYTLLNRNANANYLNRYNKITPLYYAVSNTNDVECLKILIDRGAQQNVCCGPFLETVMHLAARTGKLECLEMLISLGGDVNIQTENRDEDTPVFLAVKNGQLEATEWLLNKGVPLHGKNKLGMSLLHVAAYYGHNDIAAALLQRGSHINAKASQYKECTALHCAALRGHVSLIPLLHSFEADMNALSDDGKTPAQWAASSGRVDCLEELARYEVVNFNIQDVTGNSLISTAVQNGREEAVKWLINKGFDVHVLNNLNRTLLHLAASNGNCKIALLLLEKGIDINAVDETGKIAVHLAIREDHSEILRLLMDHNADLSICTPKNLRPIHYAAFTGRWECLNILASTDADLMVRVSNPSGDMAIHIAAKVGHEEVVVNLIDRGVPVNALSWSGNTPLCLATSEGHLSTVAALLTKGASINMAGNGEGETALHIASVKGNARIVDLLLAKNCNVNVQTTSNLQTPLHCAAKNGHLYVAMVLVSAGADINLTDEEGMTPIQLAETNNNYDVLNYLRNVSCNIASSS